MSTSVWTNQFFVAAVCGGLVLVSAPVDAADLGAAGFANPIGEGADPWIVQDHGRYLACFSEDTRGISVQISDRLTRLAPEHIVWTPPKTGPCSREIWAPELHPIGGRWYIYFAASDGQNKDHRAWVLQSEKDDPLGPYSLHGPLYTGDDPTLQRTNCWAIDLTVFEHVGRQYAIWSGWPDERDVQSLYIAPMKDPVTMAAPRTRLCANDDFLWERVDEQPQGRGLNEGPEVLRHDGRTFVIFSCSGSWQPSYKLGMLELQPGGDPLQPSQWRKFPYPVFQSSSNTYGVGHNSFAKSPDGTQDWLVYHAKWDRAEGWRRVIFTQPFGWNADGLPVFGPPVNAGQILPLPSGERNPSVSGAFFGRFDDLSDLAGWNYFGNPRMLSLRNGWLRLGSTRRSNGSEFRSGEKLVVDGGDWTNFEASVKLRAWPSQGQAGLLFRVRDPAVGYNNQRSYFAGYVASGPRVVLGFTDGAHWHEIASNPAPRLPSGETVLSVTASGNQIGITLAGRLVLQTRDDTFSSGSVGVRVADGYAAFASLQIKPLKQ